MKIQDVDTCATVPPNGIGGSDHLREAVGGRAGILVGTHGQMTASSAIRLVRRLEPCDPLWFEEPRPPDGNGGREPAATRRRNDGDRPGSRPAPLRLPPV